MQKSAIFCIAPFSKEDILLRRGAANGKFLEKE